MKSVKWILPFVLTAMLVVSFAACNKSGGGSSASSGKREIVFWDMMWGPADTYPDAVQALVNRFNAENTDNIHVTSQVIPWDNFYQVFLTAVTSKKAPDVSTGAFMQSIQFAEMGEGLPLDPIVDQWKKEGNPILNDYSEDIFNLFMYEGKRYGLPWNLDSRQILYRTDYFKQAGITELPKTWAEFERVCTQLKQALPSDVSPLVFPGGGDYSGFQSLFTFLFQNSVGAVDVNGQPDYLNPKVTETLQFINRLYVNGYIPEGIGAYKTLDADKLFQAGKAVMYLGGSMDLKDFSEINSNCAVLPPMAGPSGAPRYYTWVNALEAFSQTKDPEACLTFIKWWLENELTLWTEGGITGLPARQSFRQDPYFSIQWQKKQINDIVLPIATTPVYPAQSIYLPFSIIEGEALPMIGLVRSLVRNPDYKTIQQDVQNSMVNGWKDFE
ncbi:ABC transporter substrate-binding protein [Treponema primitia]|uniref:ABC transporter substrate-binding protein n=1 Tax=Treponema primitia TaxID=88058 RepID=UPI0002555040|nr:sugar ABC transporter substrate-binding protein [Treponema primitia]